MTFEINPQSNVKSIKIISMREDWIGCEDEVGGVEHGDEISTYLGVYLSLNAVFTPDTANTSRPIQIRHSPFEAATNRRHERSSFVRSNESGPAATNKTD